MPYRLTKIYTRSGDQGFTNLGKKKVAKDDALIEAIGTVDELNSHIGMIIAFIENMPDVKKSLLQIQNDLFDLGGELFFPEKVTIIPSNTSYLENTLDQWNETLPPLKEFILPGGNQASAATHVARTVCRRAERTLVKLHRETPLSNLEMLKYLNRLSDLLFVLARHIMQENKLNESLWQQK